MPGGLRYALQSQMFVRCWTARQFNKLNRISQNGRFSSYIQRRYLAQQLVCLRQAYEQQRYAAAQRQGRVDPNPH